MKKVIICMADKRRKTYYPVMVMEDITLKQLDDCIPGINGSQPVQWFYTVPSYENGTMCILIYINENSEARRRVELWGWSLSESEEKLAVKQAMCGVGIIGEFHEMEDWNKMVLDSAEGRRAKKMIERLTEKMARTVKT